MTNGHSILPPSSAKSWTRCTASVPYMISNADRIPPDRGSIYAQTGTDAHDFAQRILEGTMSEADLPEEFAPVLEYTSRCKALMNRWQGTHFIEAKVSLFYYPNQNGTVDFALLCDNILIIRDLKYGAGVAVHAEENEQLAVYAQSLVVELSMLFDLRDDLPVDIGIIQPRFQGEDVEKVWQTTVKGLREFCAPIGEAAAKILKGIDDPDYAAANLTFAPSEDNCRWCRVKAFCPARASEAFEAVSVCTDLLAGFETDDPDNVKLPVITALTDQQIVAVARRGRDLKQFITSCEDYLTEKAAVGAPVFGTKLVAGRQGNREWRDPLEAASFLATELQMTEREVFDLKVKSPTSITATFKKDKAVLDLLEPFITRSPGKPVLAFSDDSRPSIAPPAGGFLTTDEDD